MKLEEASNLATARHLIRLPDRRGSIAQRLGRWARRIGAPHLFVIDGLGLSLAAIAALAAWSHEPLGSSWWGAYLWIAGIIVCAHSAADILLGLYQDPRRFASIDNRWRVPASTVAGTGSAALVVLAVTSLGLPVLTGTPSAAFWMAEATLALGALAAPRVLIRVASELGDIDERHTGRQRMLLYGAGWAGVIVARSAERDPEFRIAPVGFLDDDPRVQGSRIGGLRVHGGATAIGRARRQTGASALLITMPYASGARIRRVVDAAIDHGLAVRTIPPMTELIDGTIDVARARPARVEDLLRRPPPTEHSPEARRLLTGSTVIVTGAAGQVGSELVRQLLVLQPKRIVMVDRAENTMRAIAHDLDSTIQVVQGSTSITTHPLDVTDELAVTRLMRQTDPDVVFHAAAETHDTTPGEHATRATRVNIGGTRAVVDASIDCGVERFVLVSTEEAAGQSSVAGGTMRVAEMVVSDAARRTGRAFASVRLCNGLRSNGSVVPVLESRLDDGQPLTISDPGETVYPMGIPETSWLVLEAAASSEGAGLFVLDMGAPVRIDRCRWGPDTASRWRYHEGASRTYGPSAWQGAPRGTTTSHPGCHPDRRPRRLPHDDHRRDARYHLERREHAHGVG